MNLVNKNQPGTADSKTWFACEQVFDGENLLENKTLCVSGGHVDFICSSDDAPAGVPIAKVKGCVSPGYFDIQVNGGRDVAFNSTPTPEGVFEIAAAHREFGTTALLPTVISDAPPVIEAASAAIRDSVRKNGVMGIHIEGPHISEPRHGAHAIKYLRPLDDATVRVIRDLRDQAIPVLITLAPEAVSAGQIASLVEMGAVVSIGHSDCDAVDVLAALDEGATLFTHLFNAMSQMQGRSPNVAGTAINSNVYCSFICDGHHVEDSMLGLAIRARPVPDRMVLISDAMSTVGGGNEFHLYGDKITLVNGKLINSAGALAGAHTTMGESLARVVTVLGVGLEQALRMAITNPARLMGFGHGFSLLGARVDDLIVIDDQIATSFLLPGG